MHFTNNYTIENWLEHWLGNQANSLIYLKITNYAILTSLLQELEDRLAVTPPGTIEDPTEEDPTEHTKAAPLLVAPEGSDGAASAQQPSTSKKPHKHMTVID